MSEWQGGGTKANSCLWICIFMCWPHFESNTMTLQSLLTPLAEFTPSHTKMNFTLRPSLRKTPAPLSVPESHRQEVDLQEAPFLWRFPWLPTIPLAGMSEHRRTPSDQVIKTQEGGWERDRRRREEPILHSASQHDPDKSRLAFWRQQNRLCLRSYKKTKWGEG